MLAMDAEDYERAAQLLTEAWNARRSYDVASVLGQVELELERYRDAAEHLDYALRDYAPGASRDVLKKIEDGFATASAKVSALRITVSASRADVLVDGKAIGVSPLPSSIFVDPGTHVVTALLGRSSSEKMQVTTTAGARYDINLELREGQVPPSSETVPGAPARDPAQKHPKSIVPIIVGSAVSAVGLTLAIGFGTAAHGASTDVDDMRKRLGHSGCSSSQTLPSDCSRLADTYDRQQRDARIATVGTIVTVVGGIATIAYIALWPNSQPTPDETVTRKRAQWRPAVTLDAKNIGLAIQGDF
jgi:hypothetical protein